MTPQQTIQKFLEEIRLTCISPFSEQDAQEQLLKVRKALRLVRDELTFISEYKDSTGKQSIEAEHCEDLINEIARILEEG